MSPNLHYDDGTSPKLCYNIIVSVNLYHDDPKVSKVLLYNSIVSINL